MAKRILIKPKRRAIGSDVDLRRWCIEQAIRWPWDAGSNYQHGLGGNYPPTKLASQPDVLGRATQILDWVRKS